MSRYSRLFALVVILQAMGPQLAGQTDAALRYRAAGGDAAAMQSLGLSHAAKREPVDAYVWLTLAADRGLETPERANLFNTMTTAQFMEASRKLGEVRATLPTVSSEPTPMPVKPVPTEPAPAAQASPPSPAPAPPTSKPAAKPPADDSGARIAKLEAELEAARAEVQAAKRTSVKDSHDRFAAERESLAAEIATLRADKARAEAARDQARVDREAARAQLEALSNTIREGAPVDTAALQEALRQSQMKVDMTVRAFAVIEQENERLVAQMRDAGLRGGSAAEPRNFRNELDRAERALKAAQNDLAAERNRSANLARELARARPGMLLVVEDPPPAPPSREPGPDAGAEPAAEQQTHVVADGENLSIISNRYYKTPNRWMDIYNANRDVMQSENHLVPGMKLRIP